MQRLRILHRTNASRFFMTDVKPSLTRLEEELKNQERLFSQKDTKRIDIPGTSFPVQRKRSRCQNLVLRRDLLWFLLFFSGDEKL